MNNSNPHNEITVKSDKNGVVVTLCDPGWFDAKKIYSIAKAPKRTASLKFTGSDLNYLARVLYAESSGSFELKDEGERLAEKEAILNVKHFRLNRTDYPNAVYIAKTFTQVCMAPKQFESVFKAKPKFIKSEETQSTSLDKYECTDLAEAIVAIKQFLEAGPNPKYAYDNFRGGKTGRGTCIGRSRFWLSPTGARLYKENP